MGAARENGQKKPENFRAKPIMQRWNQR